MKKHIVLVSAVLLVVTAIGAAGVTTAVSAAQAGKSSVHRYPIMIGNYASGTRRWMSTGEIGKLTINTRTGHTVARINFAKADAREWGKEHAGESFFLSLYNPNAKPQSIWVNYIDWAVVERPINEGRTAHTEGYVNVGAGSRLATWLNGWADNPNTIAINQ